MNSNDRPARFALTYPRTALVIGGSRGIGRSVVQRLAAEGTRCAIGYLQNDVEAAATRDQAAEHGPAPILVRGDLGTDGRAIAERAIDELGSLDAVVVTAVPIITGRTMSVTFEEYRRAFDVHFWGFLEAVRATTPALAGAPSGGSVVAVTSLGAHFYARYYGVLGPAKASLETLVKYLAAELGPRGIRANAVEPCLVTKNEGHGAGVDIAGIEEVKRDVAKRTPMRRLGDTDDLASAVVALLSSDMRFVTGQIIAVDGGYSLLS